MRTTEYLYGIKPMELDGMNYWAALRYKERNGKELYSELLEEDSLDARKREFYVWKALKHTRRLLQEREEYDE